jgi:hypothetical protein
MNGTLSQLLSLISYGNQYLRSGNLPADYYPANVAFKFCNSVNFLHLNTELDNNTTESIIATDPASWFAYLKQENCQVLKAYYHPSEGNEQGTPDHKLAGFVGGGGTWLIEAIYSTYSDFWAARWENNRPNDPDQNIWAVSYGRTVSRADTINFCPDVNEIRKGLNAILTEIKAFTLHHKLSNWADIFHNALEVLNGHKPVTGWYKDLINEAGYTPEALQPIYSAMTAHVFGGMGSWNDVGFEDREDNRIYEELSFYLYDYINRSLISGINSINMQ